MAWQVLAKRKWQIESSTVLLMFGESLVLSLPLLGLGIIGGRLSQSAALAQAPLGATSGSPLVQALLSAVGAGIYEEFIFRLVLMNLVGLVLLDMLELKEDLGQVFAMAASAVMFALYHPLARSPWQWTWFIYFFVAGCYLALIFMGRGFGVAVGTHIFFNLIVVLRVRQSRLEAGVRRLEESRRSSFLPPASSLRPPAFPGLRSTPFFLDLLALYIMQLSFGSGGFVRVNSRFVASR